MAVESKKLLSFSAKKPSRLEALSNYTSDSFEEWVDLLDLVVDGDIVKRHSYINSLDLLSIVEKGGTLIFYSPSDYFITHDDVFIDMISISPLGEKGYQVNYIRTNEDEDEELISQYSGFISNARDACRKDGQSHICEFIKNLVWDDEYTKHNDFMNMHFIAMDKFGDTFYSYETLDEKYFTPETNSETKQIKGKEENKMTKAIKETAVAVAAKNKTAAITVARMTAGKVAMDQITKIIKPKLPMMARGYAETPIGQLVMANLFNFAITQYMPNSEKAQLVADVMLEGAMLNAMSSLNIEDQLNSILDGVDVSKITGK